MLTKLTDDESYVCGIDYDAIKLGQYELEFEESVYSTVHWLHTPHYMSLSRKTT